MYRNLINKRTKLGLEKIIFFLILIFPFFELVSGFIFGTGGGFLLTNSAVIMIICTVTAYFIVGGWLKSNQLLLLLFLLFVIFLLFFLLKQSFLGRHVAYDINIFLRSIVFSIILYMYLSHMKASKEYCKFFLLFWWYGISFFLLISYIFDFGLRTYPQFELGHKFFFRSTNELMLIYSVCVTYILINKPNLLYLLISLICYFIVGSKSVLIVSSLLIAFWSVRWLKRKFNINSFFIFSGMLCLFLSFFIFFSFLANVIFDILSGFSSASEKLREKAEYLDVASALLGERNVIIEGFITKIFEKGYGVSDIFLGYGFSHFSYVITGTNDTPAFMESDLFDILVFYGLLPFLVFIFYYLRLFYVSFIIMDERSEKSVIIFIFLTLSSLSGHGLLFSLPVLFFTVTYFLYKG